MEQAALTIVVPIEPSELASLRTLLGSIEDQVRMGSLSASQGALLPFADLTTVHFARFAVLGPPSADPAAPSLLVFATCYDGPRAEHLAELVKVAGGALGSVFAHCRKDLSGRARGRLSAFLDEQSKKAGCEAFYVGHRGRSVSQIRRERQLRAELNRTFGDSSGRLASDHLGEAQRCVGEREELRWARKPAGPSRLPRYRKVLLLGAFGLVALPLLLLLLPLLGVWLLCIHALERRDERQAAAQPEPDPDARRAEIAHKSGLAQDEDREVQNQMTLVSDLKPGLLRLVTLRVVLRAINFLGRTWWDKGRLGGIQSIHFARWFLVKQAGVRRLVFCSNYDGSWETYVGSFVDGAAKGLTGVWSNTVGFPASRWLFWSGARWELRFKRWVRSTQVQTQVWYSAYPDLTVANVQNNSEIRRGLQGLRGLEERQAWLRRL